MTRTLVLSAVMGALLCGALAWEAGATLVTRRNGHESNPDRGGVDVGVPQGRVRVQCWQEGRKIIDETDLAVRSLGIASQMNALTFRRGPGADPTSVVSQSRTTCLLTPDE